MLEAYILLVVVCGLLCACGFYKYVYFISIGYGLAIAGGAVAIYTLYLVSPTQAPSFILLLEMLLFVIYGLRLAGFLLKRELKSASYRSSEVGKQTLVDKAGQRQPLPKAILIWITVTLLYVMQLSPMLFRYLNASVDIIVPLVGGAISVLGIILEATADKQKGIQKQKNPHMVACDGLYKLVRLPNYFGEIVFWIGVFVGGLSTYNSIFQWLVAICALAAIIYVMIGSAKRVDARQIKNYSSLEQYREYAASTPLLFPFIPIYHFAKVPSDVKAPNVSETPNDAKSPSDPEALRASKTKTPNNAKASCASKNKKD